MLIKLTDSIFNNNPKNLFITLENLALAMREGKHLVVAERGTFSKIINHDHFQDLSRESRKFYKETSVKLLEIRAYLSYVSQYIEVVEPCPSPKKILPRNLNDKTIIQVPVSFFKNSEMIQRTILLCENQEDTKLYEIIGRVYRQWKQFNIINFAFTPQGGGGSTIASEYESIQAFKSRFCLCIVDSDKLSPDSSYGKTTKGLLEKNDPNSVTTELYILNVREIENLIPSSILLELFNNDRNREKAYQMIEAIDKSSVSEVRNYLDIKTGTFLKPILVEEETLKTFWNTKITIIKEINQNLNLVDCQINSKCLEDWKCNHKKKCQCFITLPFGGNTLSDMIKWYQQTNPSQVLQKIQNNQLLSEWETIGQKLINWGITWVRVRA